MWRMASLVCFSVSELMSVMAIFVHPERAKPLATAAPIPRSCQYKSFLRTKVNLPVPPAPVTMATPGSFRRIDAMVAGLGESLQ